MGPPGVGYRANRRGPSYLGHCCSLGAQDGAWHAAGTQKYLVSEWHSFGSLPTHVLIRTEPQDSGLLFIVSFSLKWFYIKAVKTSNIQN